MTAYDQPSAYEQAPTAWQQAGPQGALTQDEPQPTPAQDMPADAWGTVEFLAKKAAATAEIERAITNVFEKRATIARRLSDASKRRDDAMAAQSAKDWIHTEVQLHALFAQYGQHVADRNALVESLNDEVPTLHTGA